MSAHPADSAQYGHLWSTPEVHDLLTDEGRMRSWLDILATLAQAQATVGLIPAEAAEAISAAVDGYLPDMAEVGRLTRETGHSTLGLIRILEAHLPESAREWVYYGATVQDLTDTWWALVMRQVTDLILADVRAARQAALDLAIAHRGTLMCGRTHGQPGLPITFGFKCAVWADELSRHALRLEQSRPRREVVQLGGGLGSMEFWGEQAGRLRDEFAARLGLAVPATPWLTARDGVAEFVCQVAMIAATFGKIGDEVLQLQRPEIGELGEPTTTSTVGSITMPHKRNPEWAEQVGTLARICRVQADLALEGMIHGHERDGRAWKAEWVLLPEACQAGAAAARAGATILGGLEVNAERMAENLAATKGYVLSEPVMRALADRIGKHTAHRVVLEAARSGREQNLDLRAALRADERLAAIGDDELDALLDPRRALGMIDAYIDAVVAAGR